MSNAVAVILAAGKSTRMKSETPKVLHPICGRPMIEFVLNAARGAGATRMVVIVGHKADMVKSALQHHDDVEFALQEDQKGTGHAVMMCEPNLRDHDGPVLILAGDTPLLTQESVKALIDEQTQNEAACVIGTADTQANDGLGRVVRTNGEFDCIVEQKDASPEQLQITEINTGCYAFDCQKMLAALQEIRPNNKQAEYYLTDTPAILKAAGERVAASCSLTIEEALGVNTRVQLATVTSSIRAKRLHELMLSGVTVVDPQSTHVDLDVSIGRDSTVYPFSVLTGSVTIGDNSRIGPHAVIQGPVTLPDNSVVGAFETTK